MSKKIEWINPYTYVTNKEEDIVDMRDNHDICDSSGYLPLKDQLNIIRETSELNFKFRLGQIDAYNNFKEIMNNPEFTEVKSLLNEFETSDFNNEQLLNYRNGDLIDKETLLQQAYNAGYRAGFFPTGRSEADEPDPSTSGVQQENNQTVTTDNKTE